MKALDLDGQPGIELVGQEWIRCKWKVVTTTDPETHEKDRWLEPVEVDANGERVFESSSTSKWTVQRGTWGNQGYYRGTSPIQGSTCVRSAIGTTCELVNDDQMARLVFKVNSGGILTYSCLTACDSSDGVIVYVDGQEVERHFDGYGTDVIWGVDPETPDVIYGNHAITVDGGLAPAGSAYAGTYAHEVVFEFYKDEPNYFPDDKGDLVSLDEPDRPLKEDYYWDGEFDKENFDLDMAEYYSFRNSVWLDGFQWTPEPLELSIGAVAAGEKLSLIDQGGVLLFNNALDYGYSVRYTLDGSEPTTTSPLYQQSIGSEEAVLIDHSCTITAMIFTDKNQPVKETLTRREVVVKASAPTFKAETGVGGTVQVTMSSAFAGNAIHYTLNGTTPTASSDTYGGNALVLDHVATIKAMCTRAGVEDSDVADYVIPVSQQPPKELAVTDLAGRKEPTQVYANDDGLLVSCVRIPGASLLYSIDGGAWKAYQGPVRVLVQNGAAKAVIAFSSQEPGKFPSSSISTTIYKANVNCTIKGEGEPSENSLVFKDGWTLFGPPVTLSSGDAQSFLNMFDFFTYDVQGKSYVKASIFEEGQAYWVFLRPGELMGNISFTGAFKDDFSLSSLTKGWHGYGANKNGSVPAHVVAWKFQNGRFELANTFKRGEGYFIYKD